MRRQFTLLIFIGICMTAGPAFAAGDKPSGAQQAPRTTPVKVVHHPYSIHNRYRLHTKRNKHRAR